MPRVDIHTHLLPEVDDGPGSMDDALEMARIANADGTEIIVATPHQRDVMLGSSVQQLRGLVAQMNGRLRAEAGPTQRVPRILLGMENHIEPELPGWVDQELALTINGTKFILSEPPFTLYPDFLDDVLFQLQVRRLVPVIAHPERNRELQRNPGKVRQLIERGMLVQISAGSLSDEFGPEARRAAQNFIQNGLVHAIASDMHRPTRVRAPGLSTAYERTAELAGEEAARILFEDNPRSIVDGRDPEIEPRPATARGRRRWWRFGR